MTPTTAAAMELPIPLPILLPRAPFPLKELGEADGDDEVPLDEPLETDDFAVVTVTPNPVEGVLPVGLVTEPDDGEVEVKDEVEVELVVVTVAPIENPPLVPKTELMLLISTASTV